MAFLEKLIGGSAAQPIEAIGNVFDKLFTSDEERAQADAVLAKMAQEPHLLQAEINKIEASHRSVFVAGWRPLLGYVCGIGLGFAYVINPIIQWLIGLPGPDLPMDHMSELVMALLGLGGLRTLEKVKGVAK